MFDQPKDFTLLQAIEQHNEDRYGINYDWHTLGYWEQQGRRVPGLPLEEIAVQVEWVHPNWASIPLPSAQALEIATADWLAEENWDL